MQRPRHVSLDDLVAHWLPCVLQLSCGCAAKPPRLVPLVPLAAHGGGRQTLGELVSRFRCPDCDGRPAWIALREAIVRPGADAPELGWSFPLPVPCSARLPIKCNRRGWRVAEAVEYWLAPVEPPAPQDDEQGQ